MANGTGLQLALLKNGNLRSEMTAIRLAIYYRFTKEVFTIPHHHSIIRIVQMNKTCQL